MQDEQSAQRCYHYHDGGEQCGEPGEYTIVINGPDGPYKTIILYFCVYHLGYTTAKILPRKRRAEK